MPGPQVPDWAADADEPPTAGLGLKDIDEPLPIEDVRALMWGVQPQNQGEAPGQPVGAPRLGAPVEDQEPPTGQPSPLAQSVYARIAANSADGGLSEWSPVAALQQQRVEALAATDAHHGPRLTFEEFEAKYMHIRLPREDIAPNTSDLGSMVDLQETGTSHWVEEGGKTKRLFSGMAMLPPRVKPEFAQQLPDVDELCAEVGRSAALQREMMASRVYRSEPFSTTNAAIAAVEKNASFREANATASMVARLQIEQANADVWAASRMVAFAAEEEWRALAGSEPEVEEVREELAYGEVLELDDDAEDEELW
eukprot:SAG25_NODE_275_length_10545_cov_4.715968_1_plen_311_part_00